jgi:hypothetical protein
MRRYRGIDFEASEIAEPGLSTRTGRSSESHATAFPETLVVITASIFTLLG